MRTTRRNATLGVVAILAAAAAFGGPRSALAAPIPQDLMARLADYAARLDSMRTRASYRFEGELRTLDRAGRPDSLKAMQARVEADGNAAKLTVIRYTEDGEDKTRDAQEKALEREKHRKDHKGTRIPMLETEQPRYAFEQIEVDPADPARVKIAFCPRTPEKDTIEGSAWVDARTGSILSAAFKVSKTSMFVDYLHFTVEFGESTPLGAAVSTITVEGRGGVLFFRKRFRGMARVSDYAIAP
jgi:hypothetical protein